jgi:TonB-linked SusC/RagA family outer membrane protein
MLEALPALSKFIGIRTVQDKVPIKKTYYKSMKNFIIGKGMPCRSGHLIKMIAFMKLGLVLLFGFTFQVAATGYSQGDIKISLHLTDANFVTAFSVIEKKSGYRIFYSDNDLPVLAKISIDMDNKLLSDILSGILTGTTLTYRIMNSGAIVISYGKVNEPLHIRGRVTDSKGVALSGVSVKVRDSQLGTVTDASGNFELRIPDNVTPVLQFSYIGYDTRDMLVSNNKKLTVVLEQSDNKLNDVVVVGYGKQKRTSVTASISSIDGEEISRAPVANLSNTLGGRVSGVISRQSSGAPGADNDQVQIRGIGTSGSSSPLVIVNGIPTDYNQLNPNEVETITILKDAAAVAPYGVAGANGVILVTTKRGKDGKIAMNYDGYYGTQQPTSMPHYLDAYGYASMLNIANQNIGNAVTYTPEQLQKFKDGTDPDHYPNTDWVHKVINFAAPITRHTLSFTGGSQKVRFYSNLGYLYQEGATSNIQFKRYNASVNVDANVTSTTLLSLDVTGSFSNQTQPSGEGGISIFTDVTEIPPVLPITFSNGLAAHPILPQIFNSGYNKQHSKFLNTKLQLEQKINFIPGLTAKAAFAYQSKDSLNKVWTTPVTFYSLSATNGYLPQKAGPTGGATLSELYAQSVGITLQGYLTYKRVFGKNDIDLLAVYEQRIVTSDNLGAGRVNYSVGLDELSLGSANSNDLTNSGLSSRTAQVGWVYRADYAFNNKYLVELSGRYDGHYYFAPGKRYAFFPAASLGWRISEEKFMKNIDWISSLKIRGSYGKSGNLAGTPFQYLTSYGLNNSAIFGGISPYQTQGIIANAQANPFITWETAKKGNIGLDASLWKGRLAFSIDVFRERRSDMLVKPTAVVPLEYGIGVSQVNEGIMDNGGIDFSINTNQKIGSDFRLNGTFNFSYARNKLIQVFESASTFNNPNRRLTGRSLNTQFGLKSLGLYQLDDFNSNGTTLKTGEPVPTFGPVLPGDIKYADIAGAPDASGKPTGPDGKIDVNDYTAIGRPLFPEMTFGLNLALAWKGIDLNTLWQGAGNASIYLLNETAYPFYNGAKLFQEQTDYWTPENTNASYPRLVPSPVTNSIQTSSFWIKDGTYLRLKTAELGYTLPPVIIQRIKIRSVRFFLSAQNLLTFTKLKYLDPELGNNRARYYFQQKTIAFGVNVNF